MLRGDQLLQISWSGLRHQPSLNRMVLTCSYWIFRLMSCESHNHLISHYLNNILSASCGSIYLIDLGPVRITSILSLTCHLLRELSLPVIWHTQVVDVQKANFLNNHPEFTRLIK